MNTLEEARRLPLWRSWIEANETRFTFGAMFTTQELSKYLGMKETDVQFAFAIIPIRRFLRRKGMNFTARGQDGKAFWIMPPNTNAETVHSMQRAAVNALKEGVILGTATPLEMLTEEERMRHESICERVATMAALLARHEAPKQLS